MELSPFLRTVLNNILVQLLFTLLTKVWSSPAAQIVTSQEILENRILAQSLTLLHLIHSHLGKEIPIWTVVKKHLDNVLVTFFFVSLTS